MKLSDAGLRRRQTKLIYPNHRPTPWLTKDATRNRSNQTGARTMRSRIGSLSAYTCHSATRPSRISARKATGVDQAFRVWSVPSGA
jgi:hypothetical protein